jgi:hypothetical protein
LTDHLEDEDADKGHPSMIGKALNLNNLEQRDSQIDQASFFDSYARLEVEEITVQNQTLEVPDAPIHTPFGRSVLEIQDPNMERGIFERYVQARKFGEEGSRL